jgi:hypothetical protein
VQSAQVCPEAPQAVSVRPLRHAPVASQQPLGHVTELQLGKNAQ